MEKPTVQSIIAASENLKNIVDRTPLMRNFGLSHQYETNLYLKREDLQRVRSYKLRGAYNKISSLTNNELKRGVVCASAGNHAQGVAYSCALLNVKGTIFMPVPTPKQKVKQVEMFGKDNVDIVLIGDTFDDAQLEAIKFCTANKATMVKPFDDYHIINGQATVGKEILEDLPEQADYVFLPIGGGGLAAGVATYLKSLSPATKIIGLEPEGAPSMQAAISAGKPVKLQEIDKFVDGAAVQEVGELTYEICKASLDQVVSIPEGKVCSTILKLYNEEAIVVEPAGALSVAALDMFQDEIKGKNVVCILSGSNNDITRTEEIKERSLLFEGLKHYFIVRFPQRAGALKEFVNEVLGPEDNITHFEYSKKHNRNTGPALVGIEIKHPSLLKGLRLRMEEKKFFGEYLNDRPDLFQYLVL
ncbi:threonine ammonia-lyase IlvA [Persicobacter diffluens]|uniref:L-threonine dehydratase n=1 Tax=Persicobacter diffluens TaxID=981 RepID=A0AAN4W1P0_9BACT|nr:L-threonine dehydratase [Persicobacter diffluens]